MRFSVPCVFVMASLICCCAIQGCGDDGVGGEVCGNGYCGSGENVSNCPGDCGGEGIVCGNGKCEAGENVSNCPADCGGSEADCGNGDCEAGESSSNCPSDCGKDLPPPDPGPTWYDSANNYTWQVNASSDKIHWSDASDECESYGGDWRVPTISDLRSLVRGCPRMELAGACGVFDHCTKDHCFDDCCGTMANEQICKEECPPNKGPDGGVYWPSQLSGPVGYHGSSTEWRGHSDRPYSIHFGTMDITNTNSDTYLRCVRSGP